MRGGGYATAAARQAGVKSEGIDRRLIIERGADTGTKTMAGFAVL